MELMTYDEIVEALKKEFPKGKLQKNGMFVMKKSKEHTPINLNVEHLVTIQKVHGVNVLANVFESIRKGNELWRKLVKEGKHA